MRVLCVLLVVVIIKCSPQVIVHISSSSSLTGDLNCKFFPIPKIDLDTIDVSNLNRQFLFQKKHVGKSKAQVCRIRCMASVVGEILPTRPLDDVIFWSMIYNLCDRLMLQVAKESVLQFCPTANITAYHDSIMKWVKLPSNFTPRFTDGERCLRRKPMTPRCWCCVYMKHNVGSPITSDSSRPVCVFLRGSPDYNVEFFRNFVLVMNALDNRGKERWP